MKFKKLTQIFLVLLLLLNFAYTSLDKGCCHDQIDLQYAFENGSPVGPALAITNPEPIRISTDFSQLDNLPSGYQQFQETLEIGVQIAVQFFEEQLDVQRRDTPINFSNISTCGEQNVPADVISDGIEDSDFHIFIGFNGDDTFCDEAVAISGTCLFDDNKKPSAAFLEFQLENLDNFDLENPQDFDDLLEVIIHELTHSLGWSTHTIQFWTNPITGQAYDQTPIQLEIIRGKPTYIMVSPNVQAYAREYYDCPTAQGAQLENDNGLGAYPHHWEKTTLMNEYMTVPRDQEDAAFTKFTFALLEDTGYYKPTYKNLDELSWGRGKGCDFLKCCKADKFPEYANLGATGCDFNNIAKAVVDEQFATDGCTYLRYDSENPQFCTDAQNSGQNDYFTGEYWGQGSRCFESDLIRRDCGDPADYGNARCLEAYCINGQIKVKVNGEEYDCYEGSNECYIYWKGVNTEYEGTVKLPEISWDHFCHEQVRPCENHCSSNGLCYGNECHCLDGYVGEDCSIQCDYFVYEGQCEETCPQGTEPNYATKTCVDVNYCPHCARQCNGCSSNATNCNSCATGYTNAPACDQCLDGYFKDQSGDCLQCNYPCQQCSGTPDSCTGCSSVENRLGAPFCSCEYGYFDYLGNCVECLPVCQTCEFYTVCTQCTDPLKLTPKCEFCIDGYWLDVFWNCNPCEFPCLTCHGGPTICTSCYGQENRNIDCTCKHGYHSEGYDCVKNVCPNACNSCDDFGICQQCQENFDPTCGCDECLPGYWKEWVAEIHGFICSPCHYSCETCNNGPDHCVTCSHETRELLSGMCLCKTGYTDRGVAECSECPAYCETCTYQDNVQICVECKGNNRDVNNECQCIPGYYDDWNHGDCTPCPFPCVECWSQWACKTCISDPIFERKNWNNCACPAGSFQPVGGNSVECQACDPKCSTCDQSGSCTTCVGGRLPPDCFCDAGEYLNDEGCCRPCNVNCQTCSNSQTCSTCKNDPLVEQQLPCNCVTGAFWTEQGCVACPAWCGACQSFNDCKACKGNNRDLSKNCACLDGFYDDGISQDCQPWADCGSQCGECDCQGNCINSCSSNLLVLDNNCEQCIDGYYLAGQWWCEKCNYKCATCQNSTSCNSCKDYTTRSGPDCACNSRYVDTGSSVCAKCPNYCKECNTNFQCTECDGSNRNPSNNCACKDNFHDNNGGIDCIPWSTCPEACSNCDCFGNCLSCKNSNFIPSTQCQQCEDGYFVNGQTCSECNYKCNTCNGSANNCYTCSDSTRINPPTCSCQPGTYESGNSQCSLCDSTKCEECTSWDTCTVCVGANRNPDNNCECSENFYEVSGQCIPWEDCPNSCSACNCLGDCTTCPDSNLTTDSNCTECLPGFFEVFNQTTGKYSCSPCSYQCQTCQGSATNCTACSSAFRGSTPDCDCNDGTFEVEQKHCNACSDKCEECDEFPKCTVCKGDNRDPNDDCDCLPSFYENNSNICIPWETCPHECSTCNCLGECLSCNEDYMIPSTQCQECEDGYYEQVSFASIICVKCFNQCSTCENYPDECVQCSSSSRINPPECGCKPGTYETENVHCNACNLQKCVECTSWDQCTICQGDNRDPSKNCSCISEHYENNQNQCVPYEDCLLPCGSCDCYGNCLTCVYESLDIATQCKSCVDGYYWAGDYLCLPCDNQCVGCGNNSGDCDACASPETRENAPQCTCKSGYVDVGEVDCVQCPNFCKECNTTLECTECNGENRDPQNDCECLPDFYENNSGNCVPWEDCPEYCGACNCLGQCLYCKSGSFLDFSKGCQECQEGYYLSSPNQCSLCDYECETCQGSSDNCTTCAESLGTRDENCDCNSGYVDTGSPVCTSCPACCKECNSSGNCTECNGANRVPNNQCKCASGYYPPAPTSNSNDCIECEDQCIECNSQTQCTQCISDPNYTRNPENACACPDGTYSSTPTSQCQECPHNCQTCNSEGECIICAPSNNCDLVPPLCGCVEGFYLDPDTLLCTPCNFNCATCENGEECLTCKIDHSIQNNSPSCPCSDGYWQTIVACHACPDYCLDCVDHFYCEVCKGANRQNEGRECICKPGFYEVLPFQDCQSCQAPCATCSSTSTNCDSCIDNSRRISDNCECPKGSYASSPSASCQACPTACAECDNNSTCTKCKPRLGSCLQLPLCECGDGYYEDQNGDCQPCGPKCATCTSYDVCLTCDDSPFRSQALPCNCLLGSFSNNNDECQQCTPKCLTCVSENSCQLCAPDRQQLPPSCPCPDGKFESQEDGQCYQCNQKCATCDNIDTCLTCEDDSASGPDCGCPSGYYFDQNCNRCKQCKDGCQECTSYFDCQDPQHCNTIEYDLDCNPQQETVSIKFKQKTLKTDQNTLNCYSNYYSKNNCYALFTQSFVIGTLGLNPKCRVKYNGQKIKIDIKLSTGNTFNENTTFDFKPNLFYLKDCSSQYPIQNYELNRNKCDWNQCPDPFAQIFKDKESYITCDDLNLTLVPLNNCGFQPLQNIVWEVIGSTALDQALDFFQDLLVTSQDKTIAQFPLASLLSSQTLTIKVSFENYCGNSKEYTIQVPVVRNTGVEVLLNLDFLSFPIEFDPNSLKKLPFQLSQIFCESQCTDCQVQRMYWKIWESDINENKVKEIDFSSTIAQFKNYNFEILSCTPGEQVYILFEAWVTEDNVSSFFFSYTCLFDINDIDVGCRNKNYDSPFNPWGWFNWDRRVLNQQALPYSLNATEPEFDAIGSFWTCEDTQTGSQCQDENGQYFYMDDNPHQEIDLSQFGNFSILTFTRIVIDENGQIHEASTTVECTNQNIPNLLAIIPEKFQKRQVSLDENIQILITQDQENFYNLEQVSGKVKLFLNEQELQGETTFNYNLFEFTLNDILLPTSDLELLEDFKIQVEINLPNYETFVLTFNGEANFPPQFCQISVDDQEIVESIKDLHDFQIENCLDLQIPLKYHYKIYSSQADFDSKNFQILSPYSVSPYLKTYLPSSTDKNTNEIIIEAFAKDTLVSASSLITKIKVNPLEISQLVSEIESLLQSSQQPALEVRKLTILAIELNNRLLRNDLTSSEIQQVENLQLKVYQAILQIQDKISPDYLVQEQYTRTLNLMLKQSAVQEALESTSATKQLTQQIKNLQQLFNSDGLFNKSVEEVIDILFQNIECGSKFVQNVRKNNRILQSETESIDTYTAFKQLLELIGNILNSVSLPNSSKISYSDEYLQIVFQKQSLKSVQEFFNNQEAIQQFLDSENTLQLQNIDNNNIFDQTASTLEEQSQKLYNVQVIQIHKDLYHNQELDTHILDLNIHPETDIDSIEDSSEEIQLKDGTTVSFFFQLTENQKKEFISCVQKSQDINDWSDESCVTSFETIEEKQYAVCSCSNLSEVSLLSHKKLMSPQDSQTQQPKELTSFISIVSFVIMTLIISSIGFIGYGKFLDQSSKKNSVQVIRLAYKQSQRKVVPQQTSQLEILQSQSQRNSIWNQSADDLTQSQIQEIRPNTSGSNNSDDDNNNSTNKNILKNLFKSHLFMQIPSEFNSEVSRPLRFSLYFSSLFIWACACVIISSDSALLNSISIEFLAGILLLGANLIYKLETVYLSNFSRFGKTAIIVINSILSIVSIALAYYYMTNLASKSLAKLGLIMITNFLLNLLVIQTLFSYISYKCFLKSNNKVDLEQLDKQQLQQHQSIPTKTERTLKTENSIRTEI